jgi:hypothetical protein
MIGKILSSVLISTDGLSPFVTKALPVPFKWILSNSATCLVSDTTFPEPFTFFDEQPFKSITMQPETNAAVKKQIVRMPNFLNFMITSFLVDSSQLIAHSEAD